MSQDELEDLPVEPTGACLDEQDSNPDNDDYVGACSLNKQDIDDGSCDGKASCANNIAPIGKKSCIGESACHNNKMKIENGSCTVSWIDWLYFVHMHLNF